MYYLEVATQPVTLPPAIINMYVVNITYMHGDADHYSDTEYYRSDAAKVLEIVTFWTKWNELDWNYRCDLLRSDNQLRATIKDFGLSNPDDMVDCLFERDITCEDDFAHFDRISIFWYDKKGVKYPVNVLRQGNDHKVIL